MTYPDADGNPISLSSVVSNPENRYIVLDFWATWCGSCVEEIPMLREVYAKYHEKGVEIYSVAENSDVDYWKTYIKENGMTWINVCDDEPGNGTKPAFLYMFYLSQKGTPLSVQHSENERSLAGL